MPSLTVGVKDYGAAVEASRQLQGAPASVIAKRAAFHVLVRPTFSSWDRSLLPPGFYARWHRGNDVAASSATVQLAWRLFHRHIHQVRRGFDDAWCYARVWH